MAKTDSVKRLHAKIGILQEAKKRLLNKSDAFICIAICSATGYMKNLSRSESDEYQAASTELRNYISKSISPYGYFDSWVIHQPRRNGRKVRMTQNDFREARIQWIDWMIKCLNEDIDDKIS